MAAGPRSSWHDGRVMIPPLPFSRRSFLVGSACLAGAAPLAVAGCSSVLNPSADPVVRAAWGLALRDVRALPEGRPREVRAAHADALATEVARACGVREDGTSPENCVAEPEELPVAPADPGAVPMLSDARSSASLIEGLNRRSAADEPFDANLLAAVDGGLVLALRGEGVEWAELVPAELELGEDDAGVFASALSAEYALVYGMGVAAPRVPAEFRASTGTSADRHRLLRDRVAAMIGAAGVTVPPAAPGYDVVDGAPDPSESAAEFAATLEAACADAWRGAFTAAKDPAARLYALRAAGLAQAGAAVFRGAGETALPGLRA